MFKFTASIPLVGFFLVSAVSCGGGGGGGPPVLSAQNSTVEVDVPFGTPPDGVSEVVITVTARNTADQVVMDETVMLEVSGNGNILTQPATPTDANGMTSGTLASTVVEAKTIRAIINPGPDQVIVQQMARVEFFQAPPGTRYVRATGSDAASGTTPLAAWRTIGRAAQGSDPGDTVYIGAGTYAESVVISLVSTPEDPTQFVGDRAGCFTGDPGDALVDAGGTSFGLHVNGAENLVVRDLVVLGAAGAGPGGGILINGSSSGISILGNNLFGNDLGLQANGVQSLRIEGNRVSNNDEGIDIADSTSVALVHNLIYNNLGRGVHVSGTSDMLNISLNTFYRNGGDQVSIEGALTGGAVADNIVSEGFGQGVHVGLGAVCAEDHNLFWLNAGGNFTDDNGGMLDATSKVINPLFFMPNGTDGMLGGSNGADDNFRVVPGSGTLDAGSGAASTTELAAGGPLTRFGSRSDGLLDGEGADGSVLNLGFHYLFPVDAYSSLSPGEGRAFFAAEDSPRLSSRKRSSADTWGSAVRPVVANSEVRWVLHRVAPLIAPEEILVVLSDDGTSTDLHVGYWDGRKWRDDAGSFTSAIASANSTQRGFDVAFEQTSGEALFVSTDGTSNPIFRTLVDGVWSAPASVHSSSLGAGVVVWVVLATRPGTDEIALVTLDDQERLVAVIWDGSAWIPATETVLETDVVTVTDTRCFDAAYETMSGDLLVGWGFSDLSEETRFATKAAGSNSLAIQQHFSTDSVGAVYRLAPDPTSDRILAAVGEGLFDNDLVGMAWSGDQFDNEAELDSEIDAGVLDLTLAWLGNGGRAVLIYRDEDAPNGVDWSSYIIDTTPPVFEGWRVELDAALPGIGDTFFSEFASVPGDRLVGVVLNDAGELFELSVTLPPLPEPPMWTVGNSGMRLGMDVPISGSTKAFAFGLKQN